MHISENVSLRQYNSFGFDVQAEYFCSATSIEQVREALEWRRRNNKALLVLGGGSNTVFTRNVSALVLQIAIDDLTIGSNSAENLPTEKLVSKHPTTDNMGSNTENPSTTVVTAGAGCNWHELVEKTVFSGSYGLENLALIPGNAGAAPIQNIGAYGKELCDNLVSVSVLHQHTGETAVLRHQECEFAYRHSFFKTTAGRDWIVTGITLELSRDDKPVVTYQALADAMADTTKSTEPTAEEVFNQVCSLRRSKLPDPNIIGNAGSFFKNPLVTCQQVDTLLEQYPNLPVYPHSSDYRKLPAAWLIDQAGWKGYRCGPVGVHDQQALVLVHFGAGNGQQIATLADEICLDIKSRFNIDLEREPQIY